jgi:dienelactone hydrolase
LFRSVRFVAVTLTLSGCVTAPVPGTNSVDHAVESAGPVRGVILRIPVRENGLVGTLVVPALDHRYPAVLRIGGAEGGVQLTDAETIASEGYAVFAIAYFGMEGLRADLEEVPLEYFGRAIEWMKRSPSVDGGKLGIVGISRGSTLALLLPTVYDDFDAVVAIAPSHVIWQSSYLNWDRYAVRSSFSYRGKALPFVPYDFSNVAANAACNAKAASCTPMYEYSLNQIKRVQDAIVPVERIHAPVLLLSGKSDSLWPSSRMGDLVVQRLAMANHPFEYRHVSYEKAGHCSINRCYDSVPSAGDRDAVKGMRDELFQFLRRYLKPNESVRP